MGEKEKEGEKEMAINQLKQGKTRIRKRVEAEEIKTRTEMEMEKETEGEKEVVQNPLRKKMARIRIIKEAQEKEKIKMKKEIREKEMEKMQDREETKVWMNRLTTNFGVLIFQWSKFW